MTFKSLFSGENGKRILIIGAAAVLVLLLLSTAFGGKTKTREVTAISENAAEIEQTLEQRLKTLLEKIDGVGSVSVMVTLDKSSQRVYEKNQKTDTDVKTNSDGGSENTANETETVLVGSAKEPLEVGVVQPNVRGAAVVCSGAGNPLIKEKVTYMVAKALNIGISKVYVTD